MSYDGRHNFGDSAPGTDLHEIVESAAAAEAERLEPPVERDDIANAGALRNQYQRCVGEIHRLIAVFAGQSLDVGKVVDADRLDRRAAATQPGEKRNLAVYCEQMRDFCDHRKCGQQRAFVRLEERKRNGIVRIIRVEQRRQRSGISEYRAAAHAASP